MDDYADVARLIGEPKFGGLLVVSDHASNRVPDGIDLGIDPALVDLHIAVDIGVTGVAEAMVRPGIAAYLARVSRLVCDFNRDEGAAGLVPETSDGHDIPGNRIDAEGREQRLSRFFRPYHEGLERLLDAVPQQLILSLHSFTPSLESDPAQARPWEIGILYNEDDRAARIAIPLLEAEGLIVGDQLPYSGKVLNATMNRHAEADGRPYLGVEVRQDLIADAEGQALWAERLAHICNKVALKLDM
ncbi:N-formylglutamate amidohydrolase [Novosphingobium sp. 9]|uniref:N-formylglutamate amidohydrolase n=1 Tax=Novosphingobium sp. 9 TaxID=2025349 RepID=UPI00391F08F1